MKLELLLQRLCMEGTDRRVVAHLLRDQPVSLVLSVKKQKKEDIIEQDFYLPAMQNCTKQFKFLKWLVNSLL